MSLSSPLGDPAEVKKIVDEILALSAESLVFDSAIFRIDRTVTTLADEHNANFEIGEQLSIYVANFKQVIACFG